MCETEFKHQAVRWVAHTFAGAGPHQFVKNFQLPFTPQFLKIKTIGYYYEGTEPFTHLLRMNRIGVVGTFHDKMVTHPNMSYKLGQTGWQDGQYQFQVLSDENNLEEDEVVIERVPKNRETLSKLEAQISKMIDKIELMEARAEANMRKHSSSRKKKKNTPPSSESEDSDDYEARGGHSVKRKQNRGSAPIVNVYPQSQPMAIPKANTEITYLKF